MGDRRGSRTREEGIADRELLEWKIMSVVR